LEKKKKKKKKKKRVEGWRWRVDKKHCDCVDNGWTAMR
jgi:hypothetical protein